MGKDAPCITQSDNAWDRRTSLSSALKETLRNGNRFGVIKTGRYNAAFSKNDLSETAVRDLIDRIDAVTDAARLLKNGNTCFVTAVTWNDRSYVIKRYNPKGSLHSLRHSLKGSRARRSWLNAYRLLFLGIPTPRPVAFIEEYTGWLLKRSWLITELAPGPKLHDYLANPEITKTQKTEIIDKVFKILARLEDNRITHGDLKHVNLIITPDGPTLIDLDSLKIHRTGLFYAYHRKKDIDAFAFHTP